MKITPIEDKVVVKPIVKTEEVTSSGFIIQRNKDDGPMSEGFVEAVGPGITFSDGSRLDIDLKPGDKVVYSKYSGTEFEDFVILPYKDIFAVIEGSDD